MAVLLQQMLSPELSFVLHTQEQLHTHPTDAQAKLGMAQMTVLSKLIWALSAGVKQGDATMAVLLQEMLSPELSFVLHTQVRLQFTSTHHAHEARWYD